LWAAAIIAGIPDELYWELTYEEIGAVLKQFAALERAANLRAGLIAAVYVNMHRRKGKRLIQPAEFLRGGPRTHMSVEDARTFMDSWAQGVNENPNRPVEDNA